MLPIMIMTLRLMIIKRERFCTLSNVIPEALEYKQFSTGRGCTVVYVKDLRTGLKNLPSYGQTGCACCCPRLVIYRLGTPPYESLKCTA